MAEYPRRGALPYRPFLAAALAFALVLAFGVLVRETLQPSGGFFSSPVRVISLASGVAAGMLLGTLLRRYYGRAG